MPTTPTTTTQAQRDHAEAKARYEAAEPALRKAQRAERKAPEPSAARATAKEARLRHGAQKANAIRDIRQAELTMRLEGTPHTRFEEPETPADLKKGSAKRASRPQADIEADLAAVRTFKSSLTDDDPINHDAEIRIGSLLREAKAAGYSTK